ncbi:LysR family transcriptional regulator [Treponema sp. TIM-1]|uniref:LysR family transcriptional regulator n=1 Tax=Treponema sp. TIM-1 TaxID=2898417 RepID=UPI00397F73D5
MNSRRLEYFIEVAKMKSFTRAGENCFVSQTAISQQIAALEEELGFALLIRNKKTVSLTIAGEKFYHEAVKILAQYNQIAEETKNIAQSASGILRIGFFSLYDRVSITSLIRDFHVKYPLIRIDIAQYNYETINEYLHSGNIDIGFMFSQNFADLPNVSTKKIMRSPVGVCMHKNHRLSEYRMISVDQLVGESIITFNRHVFQHNFTRFRDILFQENLSINNLLYVESVDAVILMVEANMGISLFPMIIRPYIGDNLALIELSNNIFPAFICDSIYNTENNNPSLRLFVELINSTIPQDVKK